MILFNTTDKIQVVLGGAITTNQLQCMSFWHDVASDLSTTVLDRTQVSTNNTTDVDIVPAPAASTRRVVKFLSVYNSDTTVATVTIKFDASGAESTLLKVALGVGEKIEWTPDEGFRVLNNAGAIKTQSVVGSIGVVGSWTTVVLGSDVTNNNAVANTMQDVTGLVFAVTSGSSYQYIFEGSYDAAIATTGSRWSVTAPNNNVYWNENTLAATTRTTGSYNTGDQPATSNATSIVGLANRFRVAGNIVATSSGNVQLRFASEIAGSAIIAKANMCTLDWRQLA